MTIIKKRDNNAGQEYRKSGTLIFVGTATLDISMAASYKTKNGITTQPNCTSRHTPAGLKGNIPQRSRFRTSASSLTPCPPLCCHASCHDDNGLNL
ncbi:hypothetical protein I79_011442 [Cricetulus griseus]|uniref:Uncharacterized protein n=1 Tax=Cricetulus griseus TaxID=10029 RepID=G3HL57_CRIGR|nr:hypothetical protein I79_011442 [Cricetulus griseus]